MESVKLIECPRDAWQGLPRLIPTSRKVEYLRALIAAGFQHIDAASFVSPKAVPQMADSETVLGQLGEMDGIEIIGIVVNEKGADRAIATRRVKTLGYPCSISETFLRRNQNQSLEENHTAMERIKEKADKAGLKMVAYISMAFGNPYQDPWSEENVCEAARRISRSGITTISLADTVAVADPERIERVMTAVLGDCVDCEVGIHLHSTPDSAAEKVLTAYQAGCRRFDSAIGGLGGCPFAQDAMVGNIPTEKILEALAKRGVELLKRDSLDRVLAMNRAIENEFSGDH